MIFLHLDIKGLLKHYKVTYRVQAVPQYRAKCIICQQAKLPAPTPPPLTNVPIRGPWQMLAADILEVPVSCHHDRCLDACWLSWTISSSGQRQFH